MHEQVSALIDDFKTYYAIFGVMQFACTKPEVRAIMSTDLNDPTSNIGAFRKDQSRHAIYVSPIIEKAMDPDFVLFYLRTSLMTAIPYITDTILKLDLMSSSSPELQFLKHIRNACAHGNRFHLCDGEPKSPAIFRGFEILSSHHGMENVLFDYIYPGDILDLFEHIRAMP